MAKILFLGNLGVVEIVLIALIVPLLLQRPAVTWMARLPFSSAIKVRSLPMI